MKKTVSAVLAAIILLTSFIFTSCGANFKSTEEEATVIMTVGGIDVAYEVYRYFALALREEYDGGDVSFWDKPENASLKDALRADIDASMKKLYVLFKAAEHYGIDPYDEVLDDAVTQKVNSLIDEFASEKEYVKSIRAANMTHAVVRLLALGEVLEEAVFYEMLGKGDISSDSDYIGTLIRGDEYIRVKQILVAFDSDGDGEADGTREEKLALAEEALAKAQNGENFDDLVRDYGNDLFMFNNTDGYYFLRGIYLEEFEEAAFALEIGEISGIVETGEGFSVIKRYEKDEDYITSNFAELCDLYNEAMFNRLLDGYLDGIEIVTNENFGKYDIFTME